MIRHFRVLSLVAGGVALGWLGLLVVGHPQYDPYGWLMWGRELVRGSGFDTSDYPSWKPLGAILGAPVAVTGAAAPVVWLLVERTLALVGVAIAYALASRIGGRVAGVLAVAGVVLASGWLGETLDGHLEPVVATLLLGAVWLDAQGRQRLAFAALAGAALARPEALVALAIYTVVLVRREPRLLPLLVVVLAALPVVWFGGDALGSGSAFRGGNLARESAAAINAGRGGQPGLYALAAGLDGPLVALTVAATAMLAYALRKRERLGITLGVLVLTWLAANVALAVDGYPTGSRYVMPEAVLITVLGAGGVGRALRALDLRAPARRRMAVRVALATAIAASAVPAVVRVRADVHEAAHYGANVGTLAQLITSFRADGLIYCRLAVNQHYQAPLAWYVDRPLAQIKHPVLDGVAIKERSVGWGRLIGLERRARQYGGFVTEHLHSTGVWQPLVLEPRRRAVDARTDIRLRHCDRLTPDQPVRAAVKTHA